MQGISRGTWTITSAGQRYSSVNINTLMAHLTLAIMRGVNSSCFHTALLAACLQQGPLEPPSTQMLLLCSSSCHGTEENSMTALFPLQSWSAFCFLKQPLSVKMKYLHILHLLESSLVQFAVSSFPKSCTFKNYIFESRRYKLIVKRKWFKDFSII